MTKIIIGSRKSALAIQQTQIITQYLENIHPDIKIEIRLIVTQGDRRSLQNLPDPYPTDINVKALFTKELEDALNEKYIDVAVHSMKDLIIPIPKGHVFLAIPQREDPRDVVLGTKLEDLPPQARVGTASSRRQELIKLHFPKLIPTILRGNVQTRIKALKENKHYDAIILAAAGVHRCFLQEEIVSYLPVHQFIPAAGQGAIAAVGLQSNIKLQEIFAPLNDPLTIQETTIERNFISLMGGSCGTPIGALASQKNKTLTTFHLCRKGTPHIHTFNSLTGDLTNLDQEAFTFCKTYHP